MIRSKCSLEFGHSIIHAIEIASCIAYQEVMYTHDIYIQDVVYSYIHYTYSHFCRNRKQ